MISGSWRTVALVATMAAGAVLPQLHVAVPVVRWLIVAMLAIVFLGVRFSWSTLRPGHAVLLAANLGMGFVGWALGWLVGGRDVALAGFFIGITPTATAAPVIVGFLRGRVDYVVAAFVLTNVAISASLPVLLPIVLGKTAPDVFARIGGSVAFLVFTPMLAALLVRAVHPAAVAWPRRWGTFSFGLWLVTLLLISANASHFLRTQAGLPGVALTQIAVLTVGLCAANFALGRWIGGREFGREASQALGQKNTAFTIYLAMTYASPLVALGPTCYVVCHNLWNSWQLHRSDQRERALRSAARP